MVQNVESGSSKLGKWLRIAVIGRNPKITLVRIIVLVVVCLVVFKFVLLPVKVSGISMLPTYKDHSINFINRLTFLRHEPERGDVVGIRLGRADAAAGAPRILLLKRIIGLPGESVAFVSGKVLIDGVPLDEPYLKNACNWNAPPVKVGQSQYYVVGDNRSMPKEDHEHGRADRSQIVGKVLY